MVMKLCRGCDMPFDARGKGRGRFCSYDCRLWSQVEVGEPDECWPFQGYTEGGYGFFDGPWGRLAHRAAYWLHHGLDRIDGVICHHCDNPACCNPAHLYQGTMLDNMRDRDSRGRANSANGERSGHTTLTNEQARAIAAALKHARRGPSGRLRNGEAGKIALTHGGTVRTVRNIDRGRYWTSVL